jgi:cation transport ATPase
VRSPEPAHRIDDELARVERRTAGEPPSLWPALIEGARLVLSVVVFAVALVAHYGFVALPIFAAFLLAWCAFWFLWAFVRSAWRSLRRRLRG